ncbi:hypothetical protein TrVGV298_001792 [Trichoderma virens]|nr:hypothetical protein TrVGV298_001792 [Trichoderma virens]
MDISQQIPPPSNEVAIYLAAIWDRLKDQINPFLQVLLIDDSMYRMLDTYGRRYIARKFMEHTRESAMYCRDGNREDRHYLGAPRYFIATGGVLHSADGLEPIWTMDDGLNTRFETAAVCQPTVPSKPTKIPRPPNAYILYRKDRHNIVKAANPGITNNEIFPIAAQILGRAWNQESREVRQKYKEMSEEIKLALLEKHPDYQYKPRKSSEKRRRTRRSQQAHALLVEANLAAPDNETAEDNSLWCILFPLRLGDNGREANRIPRPRNSWILYRQFLSGEFTKCYLGITASELYYKYRVRKPQAKKRKGRQTVAAAVLETD